MMSEKILAAALSALILMSGIFPSQNSSVNFFSAETAVYAEDTDTSEDIVVCTLSDDGSLIVSGQGYMSSKLLSEASQFVQREDIKSVIIENGITNIGSCVFEEFPNIESVELPDSVTYIDLRAFYSCSKLLSITIPYGVTSINEWTFEKCSSLRSVNIPESVEKIDWGAFRNCVSLESINIPDNVKYIAYEAFKNCEKIKSVVIPDSVKEIGYEAFEGCSNLADVIIPESVTKIGFDAFYGTPWLYGKREEDPLVVVNNMLIDGQACNTENVIINDNIKKIVAKAFFNCSKIKSVVIPDGITGINQYTFSGCTNLTDITIPDSVEYIDPYAFSGCRSLENITIPDSVSTISEGAFYSCTALKTVTYNGSVTVADLGDTYNDCLINAIVGESGDPLNYSYEITPLLDNINEYFFVKTDNPDPVSFRFIDKDFVYAENTGTIKAYSVSFADVKYTNKNTLRINDGYIFKSSGTDGGIITLQTKVDGKWTDSNIMLELPELYDACDYLINTYAAKDNFFDNMDAVRAGFSSICHYSGSYIRGKIVRVENNWALSTSPHIDQVFYLQSPYSRKNDQYLLASSLYPFRYDSLGFPSMMGMVSKRLDSSSTYEWSGSSHDTILVTCGGETKRYGGQGRIKGQGISEDKILRFFTLDGNDPEFTIENLNKLLTDYSNIEMESDVPKDDELTWKDVCDTVGIGAWVSLIGITSIYGGTTIKYTYLYKKDDKENFRISEYDEGGSSYWGGSLGYASNAWVDGRYIDSFERYVPGTVFEDHPESDIIIPYATVPYLKDGHAYETTKTVAYKYDSEKKIWKADVDNYREISSLVEKKVIDEKYLDMLQLTPEEVKEMGVDRNTNKTPDHYLIYDGNAEPGTEFFSDAEEKPNTEPVTEPIPITTATVTKPDITDAKTGDTDGDGEITLKDAVLIRRYIAGGWNADVDKKAADIDGDGEITLKDAVLIRRYIVGGWNVEL